MWRDHLLKQMAVQAIRTSLKYWTICHCLLHLRHLKRHCDHHLRNLKLCLSGMACARRALARGTKKFPPQSCLFLATTRGPKPPPPPGRDLAKAIWRVMHFPGTGTAAWNHAQKVQGFALFFPGLDGMGGSCCMQPPGPIAFSWLKGTDTYSQVEFMKAVADQDHPALQRLEAGIQTHS